MPSYLEIVVNVPQVRDVFHYHLPPELEGQVDVGHLVVVPFGRQVVQGVVLGFIDKPAVAQTRPVSGLVDADVVLTRVQIEFARRLAAQTLAPLAACIELMLPPGLTVQADTLYTLQDLPPSEKLTNLQERLIHLLEQRGPLRGGQIDYALPRANWRAAARALVRRGILHSRPVLPPPKVQPKTVRTAQLACSPEEMLAAMNDLGQPIRTVRLACDPATAQVEMDNLARTGSKALARRQRILRFLLEQDQPVEVSDIYAASGGNAADLERLKDLGLLEFGERPSPAIERRQAILRFLMDEPAAVDVNWLYAESGGNLSDLYYLADRDLISLGESEVFRNPLAESDHQPYHAPSLTADQRTVWAQVEAALQESASGRTTQPILLHGVTGSGKTEIYLRAIDWVIRNGQQAILLVPEIALTPQTVRRVVGRFPGRVGVIHSGLSPGERYDTWRRARAGKLSVIVGPRSALFAPFPKLGLIVVDESHDDSYYQSDPLPHYHAREAALLYAQLFGAVCVMGSATPDINSTYRASQGHWRYLHLPARILAHREAVRLQLERLSRDRVNIDKESKARPIASTAYRPLEAEAEAAELPPIQIVDMRQELQAGNRSIFSRSLHGALEEVLDQDRQAILFLNRRGSATYVFCRDCGESLQCPRCEIPLTYHGPQSALICHHCGYQRRMPKTCPNCGSARIRHYGTGTTRVESDLQALFPQARLLRWDYETTRQKGAHELILGHFAAYRADFLIGTQMLAKGLDLPLVTLVGVVLADVGLNLPDYRAAERSFQVLTQVAGRAGRSPLGGQVILQTFQPEHYVIQAAAGHDYRAFYQQELQHRRELGYPPFNQLVRLEYRHTDGDRAEHEAKNLAAQIRSWLVKEHRSATDIIGPVPCFFAKIAGVYRWQILLRGPNPVSLLRDRPLSDWRIEVNPPNLL